MEDMVAVEVVLEDGGSRYFMTWGRIQDVVDPGPLEQLILKHSSRVLLRGVPKSARVCSTLSEAQSGPYFFEALLSFAHPIPFGDGYVQWRDERKRLMEADQEIYYLG
jgi:hypothetical protein